MMETNFYEPQPIAHSNGRRPDGWVLTTLIFLACLFSGPNPAAAKLNVVATTEDIASLVKEVGGQHVKVQAIARGYQDAHYIQAKPSYMIKMNRADLLVYQGLELEIGWLPLLIQGARNPRILNGQPGQLDLSSIISPIEVPSGEVNRAMGDIHPLGNPHYHLDPANGRAMAEAIAERLILLDVKNTGAYQGNLDSFIQKLQAKLGEWKKRLRKFPQPRVVTYHQTWSYFLKRFRIARIGTIENLPGIPPSTRHLAELARVMKRRNTKVILQANYFKTKFSDLLAEKTGARVLSLPVSVGGVPEAKDYISLFDILVSRLEDAFNSR